MKYFALFFVLLAPGPKVQAQENIVTVKVNQPQDTISEHIYRHFAEQCQRCGGIGPVEERPLVVNTFLGGVTEDNSFGTHEFLELCEMLDTGPYIKEEQVKLSSFDSLKKRNGKIEVETPAESVIQFKVQ